MSAQRPGRAARDQLRKQLEILGQVPGVQSAVLFSADGFEIAAHAADANAAARLAAIGSSLAALGSAIAAEAGLRDFERTTIESADGTVIILRAGGANALSLAVVAARNAVLGQLLWASQQCGRAIAELLHK